MPLLSALRTLAIGTLLGPQKERQVNWYLEPSHRGKLLSQLSPYLDKIAQIIQHYAVSELVVIQDMIRVFITRIACQKAENASLLLRPILSCIRDQVADFQCQSDVDAYKVYRYLEFLAGVLEHPCAKALLLKEGVVQILGEVLDGCFSAIDSDGQQILDSNNSAKCGLTLVSWCYPVFKSFSLLGGSRTSFSSSGKHDLYSFGTLSTKDWASILPHLLRFCQVLPVGKELLSCLASFEELGSCNEGRSAFLTTLRHVNNNEIELELENVHEWNGDYNLERCECRRYPSLLDCWKKLLKSIESSDRLSIYAVGAVSALSKASLCLCFDGKSVNVNAVKAMICLYRISSEVDGTDGSEQNISFIQEMPMLLGSRPIDEDGLTADDAQDALNQANTLQLLNALESAKLLLSLLQNPTGSVTYDDIMGGKETLLSPDELWLSSKKTQMVDACIGKADDYLYVGGLGEKFLWECPETLPDRVPQLISGKRKLPSVDAAGKRIKGDNSATETTCQSAFSRGSGPSSIALGPTRRDTFRQRKPNTSRPPSMHVNDYVARERNTDGVTNSNVIAVQRVGSSGGRPPSIHVDEFMARQRERQNPTAAIVGEPSTLAKNAVNSAEKEKINRSKPLKTDLDDDLQGIDIVFDGEESVSDDKLPFPQLDDNLQQPAPVISEQRSPHSIVEETESDVNESSQFPHSGTQLMSHADENTQSEISSRMSVLRPEMPLTREPSVSSDKKFFDQSDDLKNANPVHSSGGFDSVHATSTSGLRVQSPVDSRMTQHNFYMKNSPQNVSGSRGIYDRKIPLNQPPLPPMPPPSTISNVMSQTVDPGPSHSSPFVNTGAELQPPHPAAFQVQSEYLSAFGNNNAQLASSLPMPESKYSRNSISSPGGSAGPHPPLPPTPPPFSSSPYNIPTVKASTSQSSAYNSGTSELPQTSIPPIVDT
ncbi:hypothetical protein Tsubulata_050472 [Turnera subulata]|uniref:Uncharacterized protein n=1 Tax=Turnera subulata TaxID=218843 RepID=A0A9Q0IXI5_9ROSI|nr:hypothetical protein Tsubulata_050472 [Turnera subulata]